MSRRGFTLPEIFVTLGIFTIVMIVLASSLQSATTIWRRTSGISTIQTQMGKALSRLVSELEQADFNETATANSTTSLTAPDGTAVWFLSAVDPATGATVRTPTGGPLWQRNILYYPVVPNNHQNTFGMTCTGGAGPLGLDDQCPHKVLIRKVIDGPVAHPTLAGAEGLMTAADIVPYLTRPNGFDASAMTAEAGVGEVSIVANTLLYLGIQRAPNPASHPGEVVIDLRALNLTAALREVQVGQVSLADNEFTVQQLLSVFPKN